MSEIIDKLLDSAQVWQASQQKRQTRTDAAATGFHLLDEYLPGAGWPRGAMIECLIPHCGIGELQLILPVLRKLTREGLTAFWIDAPHIPYAPALARAEVDIAHIVQVHTQSREDQLWTLENCLRSSTTGLVMVWLDSIKRSEIRRIQLAAEAGDSLCILFRDTSHAQEHSPAALRLKLAPEDGWKLQTDILKRRGGWPVADLKLSIPPVVDLPRSRTAEIIQGPWSQRQD
ncbi:translesion DNA synthesis-associated protein ImuA [Marinobacter fonticola]|uniref:translesion DNA synthesis-associated protein ImuA n=1 Tax=Marinobacter fonticola TaxID=2603215 RepID=UPI0011E7FBD3|nr:translesion DNA synthesis-associated protein ImuA [Marinobacter fonticola]